MRYQLRHCPSGVGPEAIDHVTRLTRARVIMTIVNRRLASVRGFSERREPVLVRRTNGSARRRSTHPPEGAIYAEALGIVTILVAGGRTL